MNNYPPVNPIWFKFIIPESVISVLGPSFVLRPWLSMSTVSSCDKILSILIRGSKKKKKKLRQDFSMSPVVQYSDLSWSPWLHTTTEGSVSHHNSFHLEPVGKNARKANSNLLVSQEGREAGRQAGRRTERELKFVKVASVPHLERRLQGLNLILAGSVGLHLWNHMTYALDGCEDWLQLVCMKCPTALEVEKSRNRSWPVERGGLG